ncbi:MAG: oxidoreductase, partial [Bacteroidota bacterium]|nr:oxidoreductase [Bacteroidota bacterium]
DLRMTRPGSRVDDYFEILLYYPMLRVRLKAGYQVREPFPAYVIHGRNGSFLKSRGDVQETLLMQNQKPNLTDWGTEPESEQGLLHTEKDGQIIRQKVPTLQGNYYGYYETIFQSIRHRQPVAVSAASGIRVMTIIENCFLSSAQKKAIALS